MLSDSLLDLLRCPLHPNEGPLQPDPGTTGLRCPGCGRLYPVVNGIPDMVVRERSQEPYLEAEARQWDQQATNYETKRGEDPIYMAGVEAAANSLMARPGELILDAGCGTGLTVRRYFRPGMRVVAVDLSMQSLRFLQWVLDGVPVDLVRADLGALPFGADVFDKVLSANTLQQIPGEDRRRECLRQLARVARSEARVVISTHNLSIPKKRAEWRKEGHAGGHSGDLQYIYRYDIPEFQAALASALEVECLLGAGLPLPYCFKLAPLSRLLERFFRRFRRNAAWANLLVGVCRKFPNTLSGAEQLLREDVV